ncbi:MAG: alanine dehydrogenase, partial [Solirubrobacterales bacterium]|nr:alanine dehydrogenase [Solirubrobacterales bacterium]
EKDAGLRAGVNVAGGKVTYEAVAESAGTEFTEVESALALVKQA